MKYLLYLYVFILPFHAVIVTFLQCRLKLDVQLVRFWKELWILWLLSIVVWNVLYRNKFDLKAIYKDNELLKYITFFAITSFFYIFFPYFKMDASNVLGFRYDVFFLFAFVVWMYLLTLRNNFDWFLKALFSSIGLMLLIFLPWYIFWDISSMSEFLGYSKEVSTYKANSCLAFAQNVKWWHHRLQWSFWDPIRFSVFLVVFYFIFIWRVLHNHLNEKINRFFICLWASLIVAISVFFSYTKTSLLWLMFGLSLFVFLAYKYKYKKQITQNQILISWSVVWILWMVFIYIKRALFLHPEAVLWRMENLITSWKMFFYNPLGYGLWVAWPASQLATSTNKFLSSGSHLFLPENWYVQILLEQWILWLAFFLLIIYYIWKNLFHIVKVKRDFLSIWIFTSFITILFMANFTHIFEEAATSYVLFMIMWAYIINESKRIKLK